MNDIFSVAAIPRVSWVKPDFTSQDSALRPNAAPIIVAPTPVICPVVAVVVIGGNGSVHRLVAPAINNLGVVVDGATACRWCEGADAAIVVPAVVAVVVFDFTNVSAFVARINLG